MSGSFTRLWPREADEDTGLANLQNLQKRTKVVCGHGLMGRGRQCTSFTCCSDIVAAKGAHCSGQLKKVKVSTQKQHSLSSSASITTRGSKATRETTTTTYLKNRDNDMCLTTVSLQVTN